MEFQGNFRDIINHMISTITFNNIKTKISLVAFTCKNLHLNFIETSTMKFVLTNDIYPTHSYRACGSCRRAAEGIGASMSHLHLFASTSACHSLLKVRNRIIRR